MTEFKTEQENCWQLGGEIMDQGVEHAALKLVKLEWEKVLSVLAEVQKHSVNLKKFGVGRTEDPTLIIARVVPALRSLASETAFVADQLEKRLKRG